MGIASPIRPNRKGFLCYVIGMSSSPNPHDRYVKAVLGRAGPRRLLLEIVLPEPTQAAVDLAAVSGEPGSFVDLALREHFSDLLLSVPRRDEAGSLGVYVLVEHKSGLDAGTLVQLLRYVSQILTGWHNAGESPRLVLPVIIHSGTKPWDLPLALSELYPPVPGLAGQGPELRCQLLDLGVEADDRFAANTILRAGMALLKHSRSPDALAWFGRMLELLRDDPSVDRDFLITTIHYMLNVLDDAARAATYDVITSVFTGQGDQSMGKTIAEALIEEGREEGEKAGREEGEKAGREEGEKAGREEGRAAALVDLVRRGTLSLEVGRAELDRLLKAGEIANEHHAAAVAQLAELA